MILPEKEYTMLPITADRKISMEFRKNYGAQSLNKKLNLNLGNNKFKFQKGL
jgi:hypothetical protein